MDSVKLYIEYAELFNEIINDEKNLSNRKKALEECRRGLLTGDGGYGLEISAHSFRQISERLWSLAMESDVIYKDVMSPDSPLDSLLIPPNMKSFIITMVAKAREEGKFNKDTSKNGGTEFKFLIDIQKWSNERTLQFVCIVENFTIKTGYFNWQ